MSLFEPCAYARVEKKFRALADRAHAGQVSRIKELLIKKYEGRSATLDDLTEFASQFAEVQLSVVREAMDELVKERLAFADRLHEKDPVWSITTAEEMTRVQRQPV